MYAAWICEHNSWLPQVDRDSPQPYLVFTLRGKGHWYDNGEIVPLPRGSSDGFVPASASGDPADCSSALAPLVLYALRRVPLSAPAARRLCGLDPSDAARRIFERLSSADLQLRRRDVEALAAAEAEFLCYEVDSEDGGRGRGDPTLLELFRSHSELCGLLSDSELVSISQPNATAVSGFGLGAAPELDPAALADTVADVFRQLIIDAETQENSSGQPLGGLLSALACSEARVCEVYGAASFSALSGGAPFPAFCVRHCATDLAQAVGPLLRTGAGGSDTQRRGRLLEIAALAAAAAEAAGHCLTNQNAVGLPGDASTATYENKGGTVAEQIGLALERHFDASLDSLGFRSAAEALNDVRCASASRPGQGAASAASIASVPAAECLCGVGQQQPPAESEESLLFAAAAEIEGAPSLVDLADWLDWGRRYFHRLGPFRLRIGELWLQVAGSCKTESAKSSSGTLAPSSTLLELCEGRFVKVPGRAELADFQQAVEVLDPAAAAAAVIGMAVRLGGLDVLAGQLALLSDCVEARLIAARSQPVCAAAFAFAAICAVSPSLRLPLGVPIFVDSFARAVPSADRLLLDQCRCVVDFAVIRQIGLYKGRRAWMCDAAASACCPPAGEGLLDGPTSGLAAERSGGARQYGSQALQVCGGSDAGVAPTGRDGRGGDSGGASASAEPLAGPSSPAEGEDGESFHGRVHPHTASICRAVRQKFGLGEGQTPPNPETLALVNRAIKRLAADLYAKDVHFILEVRTLLKSTPAGPGIREVGGRRTATDLRIRGCGFIGTPSQRLVPGSGARYGYAPLRQCKELHYTRRGET